MSDRPGRRRAPARKAEFVAPPDRARSNRYYRWLMHLGLPLGVSVAVHVVLFALLGLKTWDALAQREHEVGEYEAGLVERVDDEQAEVFRWDERALVEALPVDTSPREQMSWAELGDGGGFDAGVFDSTGGGGGDGGGAGGLEAGAFGLGTGRMSLLGTGGGAAGVGGGGFGSGAAGRGGARLADIWSVRVRADRVVYVVDFSGSIIVAVDYLKRELKRSVGRLVPGQMFNVIIFYSEGTGGQERFKSESFAAQLQPATETTRRAFFSWLDEQAPRGGTEPLQSMKRALSFGPDVVFLFSDGYFDDSVVDAVTAANEDVQARIVCLVFDEILLQDMSSLPRETAGARRMRQIAEGNNGELKIVTGRDLQY